MSNSPHRPCPACGSRHSEPGWTLRDRLLETSQETFSYSRCLDCRSLFLGLLPDEAALRASYPRGYWWSDSGAGGGWGSRMAAAYRDFIVRDHLRFLAKVRRPARLLDVGCGSGTFVRAASRRGFTVTGMDASEEALRPLRRDGLDAVQGTLSRNGLGERRFEVLTLFHVLEHLQHPSSELSSLLRYAAPGADLIVQVPHLGSFQSLVFGPRWYGLDPPRHLTQFSSAGLNRLLTGLGLTVVARYRCSLRDHAPAVVSSLFPRLDPLARNVARAQRGSPGADALEGVLLGVYFALVAAATPWALLESAMGRGGTLIVHARKPVSSGD